MDSPAFNAGDFVRRKDSPDVCGVIRASSFSPQIEVWVYRVQFGTSTRSIPEDNLELVPELFDPWEDARSGQFGSSSTFQMLMTYERIRKPPTRIAASFGSAKATLYPFQFKPLLKFLENPQQRLLIGDDVGLGKTIEAGYILRELRARQPIERVLIVVPARLREKWKQELRRRFDEHFDLVKAPDIRRYLDGIRSGRDLDGFLWIASFESVRGREIIERLRENPLPIDLVIVDEAHRMRNVPTLQNRIGGVLTECADAMVMLTATPVQTSQEDLFRLLNILDPDAFENKEVFLEQIEAQRPLLRALRAIRFQPPRTDEAARLLEQFVDASGFEEFRESDFCASITRRIHDCANLSRQSLVELQRDLSELSLTSSLISRTKKADVLSDRPQRAPQSLEVQFSPQEQMFYDGVAGLCRGLNPYARGWGFTMSLLMAYRYTASCVPAAVHYLKQRGADVEGLIREIELETDDSFLAEGPHGEGPENDRGEGRILPSDERLEDFTRLLDFATRQPLPDTKFEKLLEALDLVWAEDDAAQRPRRKIVVFSFFKRTLRHLEARLQGREVQCRRIDGDVPIPDREDRISEFRTNEQIRVLLSSEVGSEGIDLQFACVLVNYDLPWNPMVLEQRIGRLDRIGQPNPRIVIINMAVKGTVEERILLRLYERIGIFEDTIGEIDPILGQRIEDLAIECLTGDLSDVEQDRKVLETADAAIREMQEARRLGDEADALIAADQSFLDEVESLIGRRRLPSHEELAAFFQGFVEKRYPGSRIGDRPDSQVASFHLAPQLCSELQAGFPNSREAARVASLISSGDFKASFDSRALLGFPKAELVHLRHPLLLFAVEKMKSDFKDVSRSFALRVPSQGVQGGDHLFSIWTYEVSGFRPRTEIVPFIFSINLRQLLSAEEADRILVYMIDEGEECDPAPTVDADTVESGKALLDECAESYRVDLLNDESTLNELRVGRRKATLEQTLRSKRDAAAKRLRHLEASGAAAFALRMARHKHLNAERKLRSFHDENAETQELGVEGEEIAVGFLRIG